MTHVAKGATSGIALAERLRPGSGVNDEDSAPSEWMLGDGSDGFFLGSLGGVVSVDRGWWVK